MIVWCSGEKRFFLLMMLNATLSVKYMNCFKHTGKFLRRTYTIINDSVFRRAGRSVSDLNPTELSKFNKCFTLVQFIRIPVKSRDCSGTILHFMAFLSFNVGQFRSSLFGNQTEDVELAV